MNFSKFKSRAMDAAKKAVARNPHQSMWVKEMLVLSQQRK